LAQVAVHYVRQTIDPCLVGIPRPWPPSWSYNWWKPSDDPIRNLVKAGALIAAEIDRLQRRSNAEGGRPAGVFPHLQRPGSDAPCVV
jgi:hypothetical protein